MRLVKKDGDSEKYGSLKPKWPYADEYPVFLPPHPQTRLVFEGMGQYLHEQRRSTQPVTIQRPSRHTSAKNRRGRRLKHFDDPPPPYTP